MSPQPLFQPWNCQPQLVASEVCENLQLSFLWNRELSFLSCIASAGSWLSLAPHPFPSLTPPLVLPFRPTLHFCNRSRTLCIDHLQAGNVCCLQEELGMYLLLSCLPSSLCKSLLQKKKNGFRSLDNRCVHAVI